MTRDELLAVVEAVKEWSGTAHNTTMATALDDLDRILSSTPKVVGSGFDLVVDREWMGESAYSVGVDVPPEYIGKTLRVIAVEEDQS